MKLKNYTSEVAPHITCGRIEATLIKCGVSSISKSYSSTGEVEALVFSIPVDNRTLSVRLPIDWRQVHDAMWDDYCEHTDRRYRGKNKESFRAQAERTAWKLMQDWVEVQVSMIALRQAEVAEVFLPYFYDGNKTFFKALKAERFKGLLPAIESPTP